MKNNLAVGVDVGGTHVTAALVNLSAGTVLPETLVREQLNTRGPAEEVIGGLCHTISLAAKAIPAGEVRIGIAMPGPFDYAAGISYIQNQNKFDALYGLNLKQLLAQKLGLSSENIRFMNDAACFLQGEVFGGAAKAYTSVIGLTLGTGLGSSRYRHGKAEDAALWNAPFREGIAEEYLATRWFVKRYQQLTEQAVTGAKQVLDRAQTEEAARQVVKEYGQNLGEFLATFILTDKPEAVVVGGNIARALHLYLPTVQKTLAAQGIQLPVLQALLGEEAALVGAAALWQGAVAS